MKNLFSLDGKIALVTGASRGIGWATARAMAEAGALVVLNGRDAATLEGRAGELAGEGHRCAVACFDVADSEAAVEGIESIVRQHGRLDVLVNNAGFVQRQALADYSIDDWKRIMDTNLTACFVLAREASRHMVAQGAGRIVNLTSIMGIAARPMVAGYVAAKGGVAALTRALAAELGADGITCNAIAPGYISTDMTAELAANSEFSAYIDGRAPLGRWGRPEEIGAVAVFLASDAASYITGQVITVDGGLTTTL